MARQEDREGRALVGLAFDPNKAARLLHDTVDGREAEPGARADLLRREEWLKDALKILFADADTGIGDLDADILAGRHDLVAVANRRLVDDRRGANRQGTAVWHCVAGIDSEIDDHLIELSL